MIYICKSLFSNSCGGRVNFVLKSAWHRSATAANQIKSNRLLMPKTHSPLNIVFRRFGGFGRGAKAAPKTDAAKPKINPNEFRRLLGLAKVHKLKLSGAMILLLISSAVTMSVPFFIGKLIDFIQSGDSNTIKERLKSVSLIMLGVFFVGALANFGRVYIIQSTGQQIVMRLRQKLFKSIMDQEMVSNLYVQSESINLK